MFVVFIIYVMAFWAGFQKQWDMDWPTQKGDDEDHWDEEEEEDI